MATRSESRNPAYGLGDTRGIRLSILAARLFSFITYYTPVWLGYLIADIAGHFLFWRFRGYRQSVIDNLRHAYRGQAADYELGRDARWVFRVSSRNFWDLGTLPRMSSERLEEMHHLAEGSWDALDEVLERGNGAILLTGHVGAFDFIGQYVIIGRHHPLVLTAPTVSPYIFAGVTYLRASLGARIEVANSRSLRRVIRALRNGELVVMVADRAFTEHGYPVEFFGQRTRMPAGPVKLSREFGAPLVPLFTYRAHLKKRERKFILRLGEPYYVERTDDREADIARGMDWMASTLERYISYAPRQWVMFQKVWTESTAKPSSGGDSDDSPDALPGLDESSDFAGTGGALPAPPFESAPPTPQRPEQ